MDYFYRKKTKGQPDQLHQIIDNKGNTKLLTPQEFGGGAGFTELKPIDGAKYNTRELQKANYSNITALDGGLYGVKLNNSQAPSATVPTSSNPIESLPDTASFDIAQNEYARRATEDSDKTAKIMQARLEETRKKQEELKKQQEELKAKQGEYLNEYDDNTKAYAEDINTKYNEQFKTEKLIQDGINTAYEIGELGKMFGTALKQEESKPGLASVRTSKIAKLKSDYTSQIATKQAFIASLNGQVSMVRNYISDAVGYIQQDRDNRIQFLNVALNLNNQEQSEVKEKIDSNKSDQNKIIQNLINEFEEEKKLIETNKEEIIEMMEDPKTAKALKDAGVLLTDTPEQRAEKLQKYYIKHPETVTENTKTQIIDVNGQKVLINSKTGETLNTYGEAGDNNEKTKTAVQLLAAGFSDRIEQSMKIMDGLKLSTKDLLTRNFPNIMQTETMRQQAQAERNFVNAVLRKESGAAIAPSEFESAEKQYFPQLGDDETTLAQKKQNRETALNAMKRSAGYSDNNQSDPLGLFGDNNDPLGLSSNSDSMKIAEAIGQFESGGDYQAVGPETNKGNNAYGKYQVMDFNIPKWTKQVLGRSISKDEFLHSPEAQDKVAREKISEYYNKYGTIEDVASMWFSGKPVNKISYEKDVLGTTIPQYINNIKAIYSRLS